MNVSASVSLDEVVVSSTLVLVLRSKFLAQVSSVKYVENTVSIWAFPASSRSFLPSEPKLRTLTLGVWQCNARRAICVCKMFFSLCLEMEEFGTGMPIAFGRHQFPVSDRMGQVW